MCSVTNINKTLGNYTVLSSSNGLFLAFEKVLNNE